MNTTQRMLVVLLAVASVATTGLIVLNLMYRSPGSGDEQNPPVLANLPDFTLTERRGTQISLVDLRGKVCVVNFIFTRCLGPCPALTLRMADLQNKLKQRPDWDQIRLLSVTVDPETDTPEVLCRYAGPSFADADPDHWLFLTGSRPAIWNLIEGGFKLPVGENAQDARMPIFHSTKFVLVDQRGHIRGYYDALEEEGDADLMRDLDKLLAEQNQTISK